MMKRFFRSAISLLKNLLLLAALWAAVETVRDAGVTPVTESCVVAVALLLTGGLLLTMTHRIIKHNWVRLLLLLALYLFGIQVYFRPDGGDSTLDIVAAANNTLSIFFPSRGSYESGETFGFHLLHLLAYLFFAMIAFSFFGRQWVSSLRRFTHLRRHKNVIWGFSEGSMLLAKNILANTCWDQVIFVLPRSAQSEELFDRIDGIGASVLYRDFDNLHGVPSAGRHFFLTENQDQNVGVALTVAGRLRRPTEFFVRTEAPLAWMLFRDYEHIEPHVFNQSGLTARRFVNDYPMIDLAKDAIRDLRVEKEFRVLLLGFGWTGREMLNKIICDAQYAGSTFRATIFDTALDTAHGSYPVLFDECIAQYRLTFNPDLSDGVPFDNVGSQAFYRWLEQHVGEYDRIVVTMGEDGLNRDTGVAIARIAQRALPDGVPVREDFIYAHVREKEHYCAERGYPVRLFGDMTSIYTRAVVVDESLDSMARIVNYVYSLSADDTILHMAPAQVRRLADKAWRDRSMTLFNKDSSRASAANIENLRRLIEYGIPGEEPVSEKLNRICTADSAQFRTLAESEHLRWNAFHFTQGVRRWQVDSLPAGNTNGKLFARIGDSQSQLLKHICLTDFDDLDRVSAIVNRNLGPNDTPRNYKKTDERIIRHACLIRAIALSHSRS